MRKLLLVHFFILFPLLLLQAQTTTISGTLNDATNQPLPGATVLLLQPGDSGLITGASTDMDGRFTIETRATGTVLIKVTYIGYDDLFVVRELSDQPLVMEQLVLTEKATRLKEVNVTGTVVAVQQKGDTTQINAGAFKTNPDASAEDLVTKMPGITTQDGKVQAQGEEVQKVLVDGKEFFGDDANAVLKNLPAEVIDKIQIFDKKSEQSVLTGFDDGNTTKTLNIVTKTQFRNGTFGKVYGGYGYDDKWRGGLTLNSFKDKRRMTILLNTNNVNEQNFSTEDLAGVMSQQGGRGQGRRGGGGGRPGQSNEGTSFLVDPKNGITATHSMGLNYANQWNKVDFTGSYFVNYGDNTSVSDLFRQYLTNTNEGLTYTENRRSESENINHRVNIKLEWKPDTMNTLVFQPRISLQENDGSSSLAGENSEFTTLMTNTRTDYSSNLTGINVSAPINFRHSFSKKGRSFSINATPGYNENTGNSFLNSYTNYFSDTLSADSINQLANLDVEGLTFTSNMIYTEPLSDKSQLMFNYGTNFNKSESDKETFNVSPADESYIQFDTTLSNRFNSAYFSQSFGTSYRYQSEKWNLTTGLTYQYAQLKAEQVFPNVFMVDKAFNSVLPNARFQYRFTPKKNLNINYRSSNNAPSVTQLQNVIDNSNPLQLTTGNPDLKQNWQNTLVLRFSSSNTDKSQSLFALFSATYATDHIVNSTFIAQQDTLIADGIVLASGSQLTRPVNLDGYYTLRSFNNFSFPIAKSKSNMSFNIGGTYSKTPGLVNNVLNYVDNYNAGLGLSFSSNISEKFDFTLSSNTNYNNVNNSLQSQLNSTYYNQNSKLKIQVMPWKGLVLQTDLNHQYNRGLSQNYNDDYLLWNAAIGYKFLKKRQAELRLSVFDIMKQNNSITRNVTETYYEDVQTNVLEQYFMIQFTYNIKQFKSTEKPQE